MKCEFIYCIYNENLKCHFDKVVINSLGMCEECVVVLLPDEKLEEYKRNQLQEIINRCTEKD